MRASKGNTFYSSFSRPGRKKADAATSKSPTVLIVEKGHLEVEKEMRPPASELSNVRNIETKSVPRIKSLRKPRPRAKPPRKVRPTLSEQLANIGASASEVTKNLREAHGLRTSEGEPMFTSPSLKFIVGRLESKIPSPVDFFRDHCGYVFYHPFQSKQIKMKMFYSHMTKAVVRESMGTYIFQFKINSPLEQYGMDYDPGERSHMVKIVLASKKDAKMIEENILNRKGDERIKTRL